jgi:hypothetical protein
MIVEDIVVLGAMLMQSLYVNSTSTDAVIHVVKPSMVGTYIGDEVLPLGANPFV